MNLEPIRDKLLFYLDKAGVSPDFVQNSRDMVLDSLNEARLRAEQAYAFELNKRILQIPAVTSSTDWVVGTEKGTTKNYSVRNIKRVFAVSGTTRVEVPLEYHTLIPTDTSTMTERKASIFGPSLIFAPAFSEAVTIELEAFVWMPPYGSFTDSDWMTQNGSNYMFWAALFILNYKLKEFVPRQEGNLSVTNDMVDRALSGLIAWDGQMRHGAANLLG